MNENEAVIDTRLNADGVEKGAKQVEKVMKNMANKTAEAGTKSAEAFNNAFGNLGKTEAYENLEKDLEKIELKMQEIGKKQDRFLATGGKEKSRTWQTYAYDLEEYGKQMDSISAKMKKMESDGTAYRTISQDIEEEGNQAELTAIKLEKFGNEHEKVNKQTKKGINIFSRFNKKLKEQKTSLAGNFKTILKYAFGIRSLFVLFNKLRNALVDGFKNLAQFNNGVNPTNKALSSLMSSLTQLKNSFATAFNPILTVIQPILTGFINKISEVVTAIGMMIAKLTGASTFTKAIKVQQDYAKSLNASAKASKNALASFDELNTLQKDSGSGGGVVSPNQMFEEVDLNNISWLDEMSEKINNIFNSNIVGHLNEMGNKVKTTIGEMFDSIANWGANLNFQPIINAFDKLLVAVNPLVEKLMNGLKWCLENVLEPIGSFYIEDALPKWFELLATVADTLNTALDTLRPTFDYIWQNILQPLGQFAGETFLNFLDIAQTAFTSLAEAIKEKGDKINYILTSVAKIFELVFKLLLVPLIQFAQGLFKKFATYVGKIFGDVIDIFAGLIEFLEGVFTLDLNKALDGIKNVFKGIFNFIVDIFEGIVNGIIHGINSLSFDVPDWVPAIGGSHVGFNLAELKLPRLATGAVLPPNKPFMAVVGDQTSGTNVEAPLDTIKQALLEALAETNSGSSGDVYINASGDLGQFVRMLRFELSKEDNRAGKSFVKAGAI